MRLRTLLFVSLIVAPSAAFASPEVFTRVLSVGIHGKDVRALQIILNKDTTTRIAESGAGSSGNETEYFGPATMRAVIRFQEKYRSEILDPAGIPQGTGVVGLKTLAKLKTIESNETPVQKPVVQSVRLDPSTTTAPFTEGEGNVFVMFLSKYSGAPGTVLTIQGAGFTPTNNTIWFGTTHAVEKASSWNGQEISFSVPSIHKGIYHLSVKNARGESDKDSFFVVTDGITPEPKITSVTLDNNNIVIRGSGFLKDGNMIRTGTGVREGVVSLDGTSITVPVVTEFNSIANVPKPTLFVNTPKNTKQISLPVWVSVVNENGVSNNMSFTLSL